MEAIGLVLLIVGGLAMLVTGFMLLAKAFQTSVWWGLGYIFVPFVSLIFVAMYWSETKKPFLYMLVGLVVFMVGVAIGGSGQMAGAAG